MPDEPTLSPAAFVRAFRAFLEQAVRGEETEDPPFVARLADHLGADPRELPILAERFSVTARRPVGKLVGGSTLVPAARPRRTQPRRPPATGRRRLPARFRPDLVRLPAPRTPLRLPRRTAEDRRILLGFRRAPRHACVSFPIRNRGRPEAAGKSRWPGQRPCLEPTREEQG